MIGLSSRKWHNSSVTGFYTSFSHSTALLPFGGT